MNLAILSGAAEQIKAAEKIRTTRLSGIAKYLEKYSTQPNHTGAPLSQERKAELALMIEKLSSVENALWWTGRTFDTFETMIPEFVFDLIEKANEKKSQLTPVDYAKAARDYRKGRVIDNDLVVELVKHGYLTQSEAMNRDW